MNQIAVIYWTRPEIHEQNGGCDSSRGDDELFFCGLFRKFSASVMSIALGCRRWGAELLEEAGI